MAIASAAPNPLRPSASPLAQKLRQLGEVRRDPPRLVLVLTASTLSTAWLIHLVPESLFLGVRPVVSGLLPLLLFVFAVNPEIVEMRNDDKDYDSGQQRTNKLCHARCRARKEKVKVLCLKEGLTRQAVERRAHQLLTQIARVGR